MIRPSLLWALLLALPILGAQAATHHKKPALHKAVSATAVVTPTLTLPEAPPVLQITDASIPAAAIGQSAAVSMALFNPTSATVVIRGATSPVAQLIRLQHIRQTPEGLMQMEMLPRLTLPPQAGIVLAPGATELRLLNLSAPLAEGYETPLTLLFEDGTTKTIRLRIK